MGGIYKRPESEKWWIRYRDEGGQLHRVSSHTDQEEDAREQLCIIETKVRLKKRVKKAAELMQGIPSPSNDADTVSLEARVSYVEHRLKALEILVHEVLVYSDEE